MEDAYLTESIKDWARLVGEQVQLEKRLVYRWVVLNKVSEDAISDLYRRLRFSRIKKSKVRESILMGRLLDDLASPNSHGDDVAS